MTTSRTFVDDVLRALDGEATPEEERALARVVAADPEASRAFGLVLRLHGNLGPSLRERGTDPVERSGLPAQERRGRAPIAVGMAAAVAALACLFWIVRRDGPVDVAIAPRARDAGVTLASTQGSIVDAGPPPSATERSREVLLRYDFEDGRRQPPWLLSPVDKCPPRPGSQRCLRAQHFRPDQPFSVGMAMGARTIFTHREGTRIEFDYWLGTWLGDHAPYARIWIHDRDQNAAYYFSLPEVRSGAWVHVEAPLDRFVPQHPRSEGQRLSPGATIDHVVVAVDLKDQDVFFLDDFQVTAPAD
jgi:hypothetical protein